MNDPITDETALATLAVLALNDLYSRSSPCCPTCCWWCDTLKRLSERPDGPGSLADILTNAPIDPYGFRTETGTIDRDWMAEQWTSTDCHKDGEL